VIDRASQQRRATNTRLGHFAANAGACGPFETSACGLVRHGVRDSHIQCEASGSSREYPEIGWFRRYRLERVPCGCRHAMVDDELQCHQTAIKRICGWRSSALRGSSSSIDLPCVIRKICGTMASPYDSYPIVPRAFCADVARSSPTGQGGGTEGTSRRDTRIGGDCRLHRKLSQDLNRTQRVWLCTVGEKRQTDVLQRRSTTRNR